MQVVNEFKTLVEEAFDDMLQALYYNTQRGI